MFRFKWYAVMLTLAIVTVAVAVGGCGESAPTLEPTPTDGLEDTTWILEAYGKPGNLRAVLEGSEITAIFDSAEGQVNGSAGCNNYFGSYKVNNDKLAILDQANTEMACFEPEGIMEQENQYLKILRAVVSYQVQDGELQIKSDDEILIYGAK
jgi:heat shock protein HslJ